jgi:hypothetical protein
MLETLAGRLKWERTPEGIRVQLPFRFRWESLPPIIAAFFISLWIDDIIQKSPIKGTGPSLGTILGTGLCIAAMLPTLQLAKKVFIILTPTEVSKAISFFGKQFRKCSRQNNRLYDLRSNLLVSEWSGKDIDNRNSVEINQGSRDVTLASWLTDIEAEALITKMREIYPFPKDEPTG